ncbi:MAG: hypothetical protein HYR85_03100 [Planctomycetes bacterium]|nr:hypothetical protein [Planctomycetota bacterium]MBI3847641.1 hypothetical protein [Planctomycetota bacterium]
MLRSIRLLLLVFVVISPIVSSLARAEGVPATITERSAYVALERESSGLDQFAGGGTVPNRLVLPHGLGTGTSASLEETNAYAERQAASPGVENFVGGDFGGFIIALAFIAAIVIIVWLVVNHH